MAYKMVALSSFTFNGVAYNRGDLFPQIFPSPPGGHPWSDALRWEALEIPDDSKADIYDSDMDYDTGEVDGEGAPILANRLLADSTLVTARIAAEKARLQAELKAGYDARMDVLGTSTYPDKEEKSFSRKLKAAEAWDALDNTAKETAITDYEADAADPAVRTYVILLAECDLSGTATVDRVTVDGLVATILAKDAAFAAGIGALTKDRKAHWAIIDGVTDDEAGLDTLRAYNITWSV